MRLFPNIRTLLLGGSAVGLLAGCTQADLDDVASPGSGTPIVVNPIVNPGGGGTGAAAFASRATAPQTAADCPAGTSFEAGVSIGAGLASNFCSLTDIAPAVSTAAEGDQIITGTRNIPFSADPILIAGTVFIGNPNGASGNVTFAAGQRFVSRSTPGVVDLLVVSRGSQLNAVGTNAQPIIFTSLQDYLDNGQPDGSSSPNEWGGLAINGRAPLNECTVDPNATPGTDACRQNGEGGSGQFGGAVANDSSGAFAYIRVQQAGFRFTPTNELNSIALQGVGSGTRFDHIQVHLGGDDGFEWFGGTVNGSFLVVTGANDDSFDWTDGWRGRAQFLLASQVAGDDNGIEADNNGDTVADASPRSAPDVSNVTLIGDGASGEGIQVRAGVAGTITNAIVTNFAEGLEFNPAGTGPNPVLRSIVLAGNTTNFSGSAQSLFNAGTNNTTFAGSTLAGVFPGVNELSATPTNPTTVNPAFAAATYVGAFDAATETADDNWTSGWSINIPGFNDACPTGTTLVSETPTTAGFTGRTEDRICVVNTPVIGNVRLTNGNLYRLNGTTFIGQDGGPNPAVTAGARGVLTIDAGVTIFGNQTAGVVDLLVVTRGSQIFANGSAVAPVVLTSRSDLVNGGALRPATATGEIGGIAINGRAPLNECTINPAATPGSVDCQQNGEGGSGGFGGATANDNSGRINFMQIRYAGFRFTPTNELNSLALQGVGSGTDLDFIQVINGADDAFEWFGGTTNASHLVATGANDDSLDWTDGWIGAVQYAIVRQNVGDDNGIEADNNGDTVPDALPRSTGIASNITLIGDGASGEGIQVRAGVGGAVINSIATNFAEGLEFNQIGAGTDPIISAVTLTANVANFAGTGSTLFATNANNLTFAASTLTAPNGFTTPLVPGANESDAGVNPVAVCGVVFGVTSNATCGSLDAAATYRGAVSGPSDRWFAGWTLGL